jgi:predicted porin
MFKKTAIALAVAGAYGASVPAQAVVVDEDGNHQVYGFVNVSMDYAKEKNGGTPSNIFLPPGSDGDIHLGDQANSRFGFMGSQDLGNGLTAGYRIEIGFGTSAFNRGSVTEDAAPWDKRLAYVDLTGNFGQIRAGNTWGKLYEYLGYNTFRSHGFGGASWYESTRHLNYDSFGLRVSDAVEYNYGSGGYGSDPFTFSVQGIFDQRNGAAGGPDFTEAGENDEVLDAYTIAGAATFGNVTVNAAYYGESNPDGVPEPSLMGLGARFQITDAFMLAGRVTTVDRDNGTDDPESISLHAEYNFGNGLSAMAGYGMGSDDDEGDLDAIFLQMNKNLGSGTDVYIEFEHASRDGIGGAADPESTVVAVGMKKSF